MHIIVSECHRSRAIAAERLSANLKVLSTKSPCHIPSQVPATMPDLCLVQNRFLVVSCYWDEKSRKRGAVILEKEVYTHHCLFWLPLITFFAFVRVVLLIAEVKVSYHSFLSARGLFMRSSSIPRLPFLRKTIFSAGSQPTGGIGCALQSESLLVATEPI
jgi:hypothetical protein